MFLFSVYCDFFGIHLSYLIISLGIGFKSRALTFQHATFRLLSAGEYSVFDEHRGTGNIEHLVLLEKLKKSLQIGNIASDIFVEGLDQL